MKPEEQRIVIAEACGWQDVDDDGTGYPPGFTEDQCPEGNHEIVPDYLNDLNAMHEAEKVLTSEQKDDYVERLSPTGNSRCPYSSFTILHATAAQRAEAFLKTIGKWKD